MINNPKNFKHIKAIDEIVPLNEADEDEDESESIYLYASLICPYCRERYDIVYDPVHGEIICHNCMSILQEKILL